MADPTVPWGIPLFDDNTPFAPIQAPFNAQSEALDDALSDGAFAPYTTKALLDAAPGTRVGQHATVYADGSDANNGDYSWNGAEWILSVSVASVHRATGNASGLGASMSVAAQLSLPAGTWRIWGRGGFNWSTSTPQKYTLQINNATAGTAIDTAANGPWGNSGDFPAAVEDTVALSAQSTITLQAKASASSGTQLFYDGKLFATRVVLV